MSNNNIDIKYIYQINKKIYRNDENYNHSYEKILKLSNDIINSYNIIKNLKEKEKEKELSMIMD